MANAFYQPGGQRGARVQELFGRIAPRYDLINDLQSFGLHRYWKRRVLALAKPGPKDLALDLCCGTGDLALMLARRGAQVIGADFSENMLGVALTRSSRAKPMPYAAENASGKLPLQFIRGDALSMPFPDRSFDIVTIAYGLRNLANVEAGLGEMQRVSKPGARLFVLDFGKPDNPAWRSLYFAYLRLFVPLLGLVFCGSASAYAYILESLQHYPAQQGVAQHMRNLGMTKVKIVNLLGGMMSINCAERAA